MWNLIRAQSFQNKGDNFVIYTFLFGAVIMVVSLLFVRDIPFGEMTGAACFLAQAEIFMVLAPLIVLALLPCLYGKDTRNKTMYYEILSGYPRTCIHWARTIGSVIWVLGVICVLFFLPVLVSQVLNGWGAEVAFSHVILRLLMMFAVLLRLCGEVTLLTVLTRNCYATIGIMFGLFEIIEMSILIYESFVEKTVKYVSGFADILWVMDFFNYRMYFIDGKEVAVSQAAVTATEFWSVIGISLLIAAVALFTAGMIFKKQDLN